MSEDIEGWRPWKAHAIDEYMLSFALRAYPDHAISVTNKFGHTVCGYRPADPVGVMRLVEARERTWVLIDGDRS